MLLPEHTQPEAIPRSRPLCWDRSDDADSRSLLGKLATPPTHEAMTTVPLGFPVVSCMPPASTMGESPHPGMGVVPGWLGSLRPDRA